MPGAVSQGSLDPTGRLGRKALRDVGAAFVSELSLSSLLYATGIPAGGTPCGERLGPVRGIRGGHSGQPQAGST